MKIRAQIAMVLNLDKCIGCHTCSITCKNVWTSREGIEYAWYNNVETKPGIGYPKEWANQKRWRGGWVRNADGSINPRIGGKWRVLANIFANPDLPEIDDYYEPFTFDYQHLHTAKAGEHQPTARPRSRISGQRMRKIEWGPNWEEILGTEFAKRRKDVNFDQIQADIYGQFEHTFMLYLPRLCEHCLNPSCVASCPSGAIYKREEDGIVLIDQDKCRGWRMCVSACPYKKIYYNWQSGKAEKCIFCYPRIEVGQPTVCSETCVGRIRYLGVLLYDADRIEQAAAVENEQDLYTSQLSIFLDPHAAEVQEQALPFLRIMFGFSSGMLIFFMLGGALRSAGDARTTLTIGATVTVLNIVLNVILIRGLGPIPALGAVGAAIGTTTASGVVALYALFRLIHGGWVVAFPPRGQRHLDPGGFTRCGAGRQQAGCQQRGSQGRQGAGHGTGHGFSVQHVQRHGDGCLDAS